MDKDVARSLLPLVNDPKTLSILIEYSEYRISRLKDALSIAKTFEEVQKLQGAIRELSLFKTLRDEVQEKSKGG